MDCNNVVLKKEASTTTEATEAEQKQINVEQTKKHTKEEKARKKDDKSIEQVLKALNSLETTEEKLAAMCKKYSDILDENRKLQLTAKQAEKRMTVLQREKEQLQTEHSKAVLTRSRLESLCRELQRQNKAIKDESLLKIREEEEKRKDVSAKFQSTLNEITALMQQNNEKNTKLREDNIEMTKKFKTVCEQYEIREQQVEKITKQMKLEAQLSDAKLAKAKMEMAAEKEILLKEKQQLLLDLTEYQAKCRELQETEVNLRSQISLYTDKYDEFQNALSRSNEVFGGFKGEMEKMSKKICKLEKETTSWKQRWEKSHQALLEMAADKQQRDNDLALATRQLAQLQKLCRTLQAERTLLLAQLKNEGIAKPAVASSGDASIEAASPIQETVPDSCCMHAHAEPCKQDNHTAPVPKTKKSHKKVHMNEQKASQNDVTPCKQEKSLPVAKTKEEQNNQSSTSGASEELLAQITPNLQVLKLVEENAIPDDKKETNTIETAMLAESPKTVGEQNLHSTAGQISTEVIPKSQTAKADECPLDAQAGVKVTETDTLTEFMRTDEQSKATCSTSGQNPVEITQNTTAGMCPNSLNNAAEQTERILINEDMAVNHNLINQTREPEIEILPEKKNVNTESDLNDETERKESRIEPVLENIDISEKSVDVNCSNCERTTVANNITTNEVECPHIAGVKQTDQPLHLESPETEAGKSPVIALDNCEYVSSGTTSNNVVNERLSTDCHTTKSQFADAAETFDNMISLNALTDLKNDQNSVVDQLNNSLATADSENNIITNQLGDGSNASMKNPTTEASQTPKVTKAGNSDFKKGRDGGKKRKNK